MAMKFAICNETFGDWPIEVGMEMAKAHNYTGIEVAPFTLGESVFAITPQQRCDYRKCADAHELEIVGLHWLLAKTQGLHLTNYDEATRKRTCEYLQELVRLCHDLGGKIMVLGSPLQRNFPESMTHAHAMSNAASLLCEVVPSLERYGIQIAIEPLGPQEGNFLNFASQGRELIEMIDSPQVRLHLDVKAMSSEGEPIANIIRANADLMIHFHANDPNRLGPGMGDVDQAPIFQALNDIEYAGWASVEVFDYSPGVETILSQSMKNMLAAIG
jgi:sugar phosphate isomerase/epimerase